MGAGAATAAGGVAMGVGGTIGIGITVGGYIHRTSKKIARWRTTKTLIDPKARRSVSQISIVLNSLFLRHDSTNFFKVKGCCGVYALTPAAGCHRVLCVGHGLGVVDARQNTNRMGSLE